ncbi:inositol-3-phosphate synthase [Vallicoccus soli]|uniref:Inositol-3-phosphate synthase n=1 Tax=Vallicoccus soli TaxID=2339232 RepID=A0A3A3Z074_9ACTN|nr:inositol-3-phosphate synthase [Vallicoccus soli]
MAVVGLGGAVASTAVAGVELLRLGSGTTDGLPFAGLEGVAGLARYEDLVFGGWDLCGDNLAKAAEVHGVLDYRQMQAVSSALEGVVPWPAAGDEEFCRRVGGDNVVAVAPSGGSTGLRPVVDHLVADLERFRSSGGRDGGPLDAVVVVNLASTERYPDLADPAFATAAAFEAAVDAGHDGIPPAMVYAYAAVLTGCPFVNFTPSVGADVPALEELARRHGVPVAGKDGKTGQTMMKTVLAPAFRSRALRVEGWYSTNILGNRDGQALDDPASLASKLGTKGGVLDGILGYPVEDHVVRIDYYRPRGDAKEAWDNIDLVGFLGQRMQVKVDFLCRDSVLAAPLVLELARFADLAQQRGESGPLEQLGYFFKSPHVPAGARVEHALHEQERALLEWVRTGSASVAGAE